MLVAMFLRPMRLHFVSRDKSSLQRPTFTYSFWNAFSTVVRLWDWQRLGTGRFNVLLLWPAWVVNRIVWVKDEIAQSTVTPRRVSDIQVRFFSREGIRYLVLGCAIMEEPTMVRLGRSRRKKRGEQYVTFNATRKKTEFLLDDLKFGGVWCRLYLMFVMIARQERKGEHPLWVTAQSLMYTECPGRNSLPRSRLDNNSNNRRNSR